MKKETYKEREVRRTYRGSKGEEEVRGRNEGGREAHV